MRLAEAHMETTGDQHRDPSKRPQLVFRPAVRSRPCSNAPASQARQADFIREATPEGPLERRASIPPSRQAACQAYADFRDTRNAHATCGGFMPAANIPAAWNRNRTRSRLSRSTAVKPPPSGHLMSPDYTHPRRPRHPEAKTSVRLDLGHAEGMSPSNWTR